MARCAALFLLGTLAMPWLAAPANAVVVTRDSRGAAVQISGESPAAGIDLFSEADAAFNNGAADFAANLALVRDDIALSAGATTTQASSLESTSGLLSFTTQGSVSAHGNSNDAGDSLLAAAVSNATLGFTLETGARLHLAGNIDGSGPPAPNENVFGLTAITLLRGSELVVALDSSNPGDRVFDLIADLAPGDYVMTIVASTSGTVTPGNGPAAFTAHAGYQLGFSARVVPVPGGLALLVGALAPLGLSMRRGARRPGISVASC